MAAIDDLLEAVRFNADGLIPAITQDVHDGSVLMMAWMNRQAIELTLETGFAHYYSRSRQAQWKKGESSGHVQKVCSMHLDCDGDTLLLKIEQEGAACHTMRRHCFYRQWKHNAWEITAEPLS